MPASATRKSVPWWLANPDYFVAGWRCKHLIRPTFQAIRRPDKRSAIRHAIPDSRLLPLPPVLPA
ncbi:hypothetical protein FDW98_05740 [Citrobacter sp. wls711]|nr:hypothetical protein FDW98_05740 [Citrobacter sp. wls711]